MVKGKENNLENKLLGLNADKYEKEIEDQIEEEIALARKEMEKRLNKDQHSIKITDINEVSQEKRFDKESIYKIFNRKQKIETFVNGEQAQNLLKYTDDYVVKFDHRIEEL